MYKYTQTEYCCKVPKLSQLQIQYGKMNRFWTFKYSDFPLNTVKTTYGSDI